ncbi:hypothetical protein LXL04_002312 [Taraxacum kok-saghyz]
MGSSPEGRLGSPTLPVPRPKSPPELYGKRRELAKVVMLEREIGFLQEELKSTETLQPASRCIKEVADFVVANPEPLITTPGGRRLVSLVVSGSGYVEVRASTCHGYVVVAVVMIALSKCHAVVHVRVHYPSVVPAHYQSALVVLNRAARHV